MIKTNHRLWRTTFFACLIIGLCFLFTAVLAAVSWEGELNPTEFDKWEVVKLTRQDAKYVYLIAKNPDEFSSIYLVSLLYRKADKKLTQYQYFKDGVPYIFDYWAETDSYREDKLPPWKKQWCVDCHPKEALKGKQKKREEV